ncbi:MAG TPA: thioredoxin family protein [Casimicrobiaceae bacterium]|nr:thioredoxin family protein [Casimicrobiaceae bacterium]
MDHPIVTRDEWPRARIALLDKEKAFTHARDAMTREQRALPWEAIDKEYVFDGPRGREGLGDLFDGRSQLVVYHFMFAPDWSAGCPHCSFWADNFDRVIDHLAQRDVTMVAVSRAPLQKLDAYKQRMGWSFKWVSSGGNDFNFDFNVSFSPAEVQAGKAFYNFRIQAPEATDREGLSVFCRDEQGRVFRTYSTFARGIDMINSAYNILDLVPKGRDEGERGPFWVRRHDEYTAKPPASS